MNGNASSSALTSFRHSIKHLSSIGNLPQAFASFSLLRLTSPPVSSLLLVDPISSLLSLSSSLNLLPECTQLHSLILSLGLLPHPFLNSRLTSFYSSLGFTSDAHRIAEKSTHCSSWNSLISHYVRTASFNSAVSVYSSMLQLGVEADVFTYPSILKACAETKDLILGREVHKSYANSGLEWNLFIHNALVAMYAKCGQLEAAREVFDEMPERDIISWNSMILGYASKGMWTEAFAMFSKMRNEGTEVNCITWNTIANGKLMMGCYREALLLISQMRWSGADFDLVTLVVGLNACSRSEALRPGKEIHGLAIRSYSDGLATVVNALISMYSRCQSTEVAYVLFRNMCDTSLVTWNSMITGFAINDEAEQASVVFRDLVQSGHKPNYVTIVTILALCARIANLQHGRELHCFITKNGFKEFRLIWNSLVDMYSKAGKISVAQTVFDTMTDRDQVSYTSLITGYGVQGEGRKAMQLFDEMLGSRIEPDSIAMVSVLSACSHSGLVAEGQHLFDEMAKTYRIEPRLEHYSCMVDLYARAGLLDKAEDLVDRMPIRPSAAIWASLLGACLVHGNTEIGERAANRLLDMKTQNAGHYVLIANMYAAVGCWEELARVRMMMRDRGVRKAPGCAWADLGDGFHPFLVGDRSSPLAPDIYTALEGLYEHMSDLGYVENEVFFKDYLLCVE